ncbi:hypothetical protein BH23ACT10_BH23ACT10_17560 [soil metagenome]
MTSAFISRLDRAIGRWFAGYANTAEAAALYRIAFVTLVLVFQGPPTYAWIDETPEIFFRPPSMSLATVVGGRPPLSLLVALTVVVVILYVAVLFGYRTRWSSLLLGAALLIGNSFVYTFGKINHDEMFIALTR